MSEQEAHSSALLLFFFFILLSGKVVVGGSLDTDKEVLLKLKLYLDNKTLADRGGYIYWNTNSSNPCEWKGISCSGTRRVVGVDLSHSDITGEIFKNFSQLTELTHLDLSQNTLFGEIPEDLRHCRKLLHLNLSHNILDGELNLTGLKSLHTLDLSSNRFYGEIGVNFPAICDSLVTLNVSGNNLTGRIENCFDQCVKLQYLDLSTNNLSGNMWMNFARLKDFSVAENHLNGIIPSEAIPGNCSLEGLDLSQNGFVGEAPKGVANCKNLTTLNLSSNKFTGGIPVEIGSISGLKALYLGNNSFSREIPDALLNLTNLVFLDLSRNSFGGDIQEIFGKFKQVSFLLLHSNNYTGGLISSGILKLPNIWRLDLSYNNFSGPLPVDISQMSSLKFLMLSYNQFNGSIPPQFGNMTQLQALDIAFNNLTGPIPSSLGNLSSLLWLMLANNSLSGEIPPELGNCSSLLWLNLANNKLSGNLPSELSKIGRNAMTTFESNRRNYRMVAGSGECLGMKRWIPADYPPFSFVYSLLTRKTCRDLWDKLLKGYGIFPYCTPGSSLRIQQISGYVQLTSNQLSGEIPSEIGTMVNFSMLHLGFNNFSGKLPPEMAGVPIVVLNITSNKFSGEIPEEVGNMKCLMNLDLSYNNFSGTFPTNLNKLTELNKFNISYNPLISGVVPSTGQFATFEKESYLGNPLLILPEFIDNTTNNKNTPSQKDHKTSTKVSMFLVFLVITLVFTIFGVLTIIVCVSVKGPSSEEPRYLLRDMNIKQWHDSSSSGSSPWMSDTVKVIRLNKTAFTHDDILKATSSFSEERIIGKGGFGTVYKGVFSDGRHVAVKKLQREGLEGEKEFKAEMEVLSGHGFGWPHPNLVTLYGWCLNGSEKILIYEYIEGGSLEDVVTDRTRLTWRRRLEVATDVARALVYLHHECYPAVVHRDVKASNVLLDKDGKAKVTDFGLARVVDAGDSHVSTMVAGTVGYVAPEYGHTWQATTKGDVYSFGVLVMELATGRRAVDGGEECLVEWARRVMGYGRHHGLGRSVPVLLMGSGLVGGAEEMGELLRVGVRCTADSPQARPNMKEVLAMLIKIYNPKGDSSYGYGHIV
ncbi:probable LRR receptor-like serine/threonine-protein kinase At1g74360 [Cajanus cajan]|uniref:probable LRR receptor-like serine/threonine-protein kinase At1g74360 n=1 Tax=Cajanus cajan TaxID=3821 RepID=UPI00098D9932|nr:probable LRR receptor-like serine/threonine-protein kinase At1g74360 [Cajanus cajan]XP_020224977.1 probable LRR receptor-like serine/threonine-protein kinase At1g74360 [Cajanus cajan]